MAKPKNNQTVTSPITFEEARIVFRNFEGKEGKFNPKGRRNFCVLIDTETANMLKDAGWNIKWLNPRTEEDERQAYLQVSVSYTGRPPKIVMISSRGRTDIQEDSVHILDWADVRNVDFIVRPYNWEVNGNTGVKAYLKTMYFTINEDELELKYSDAPDSAASCIGPDCDEPYEEFVEEA